MKARTVTMRDTGSTLSPFNAFLLIQGLETLSVRMDRHVQNARAVAEFLRDHPQVAWVAYAGLPESPFHDLAQNIYQKGQGAIFTFGIKSSEPREAGKQFIESLHILLPLSQCG